jgi:hypothetical protein
MRNAGTPAPGQPARQCLPFNATASKGRILFYGGCHAVTLAGIYRKFACEPGLVIDHIVNFEIIAQRIAFDYDSVARYDAVVFSPIENRVGYETARLEDACARHGTRAISYPWIEWRGYHPFSEKGDFITRQAWRYPGLHPLARETATELGFIAAADRYFSPPAMVRTELERTTEHLMAHEERHRCSLRLSAFILAHYRLTRLFLTPDHPAKPIYDMVVRTLNQLLSIPFDARYFDATWEPQHGITLPIHPRVAEALELSFVPSGYQNVLSDLGDRVVPLAEYLRLCRGFGRGNLVLRAKEATYLKRHPALSTALPESEKLRLPPNSLLQCQVEGLPTDPSHARLDINWTSAAAQDAQFWPETYIYRPHWEVRPPR